MANIITEEYTLPSKGLVYNKTFDPTFEIRSMTLADELKRLSPSNNVYKHMSEIIDNCLVKKFPISAYDLCMGDYIFLLHKLRVVTYGTEYKLSYTCPFCGEQSTDSINLDEMSVKEFDESVNQLRVITLPTSGLEVVLRLQTPRDLDNISRKVREDRIKFPDGDSQELSYMIESYIDTVNGEGLDPILGRDTLKTLGMKDINYLVNAANELNDSIGVDSNMLLHCENCGREVYVPFRYTDEFFRPSNN